MLIAREDAQDHQTQVDDYAQATHHSREEGQGVREGDEAQIGEEEGQGQRERER